MATVTAEQKKKKSKNQIAFDFSLARTPDMIRRDNKEEKGKIHYLIPKEKVAERRVQGGYHLQQILFNVDFRFGHDGINEIARQVGISLANLPQGNIVVFFNTNKTSMKIAFSDKGIFHFRQASKIEERAIPEIMKQLNTTGKANYPEALQEYLKAAIGKGKSLN